MVDISSVIGCYCRRSVNQIEISWGISAKIYSTWSQVKKRINFKCSLQNLIVQKNSQFLFLQSITLYLFIGYHFKQFRKWYIKSTINALHILFRFQQNEKISSADFTSKKSKSLVKCYSYSMLIGCHMTIS